MTGIPSEIINYEFAGGIDEKTDPWVLDAPRVQTLLNGVFTKNGQIRKRFGYDTQPKTLAAGGSRSAGVRVGFRKSEQLVSDGHNLHTYSPALSAASLPPNVILDQVPELTATRESVDTGPVTAWDPDCNFVSTPNGNYEIYSWTNGSGATSGDVFVTVRDAANGGTLFRSFQLTSGGTYRQTFVVVVGTIAIVVYVDTSVSPGLIKCRRLDCSSPSSWATEQTLRSDLRTGAPLDARGLNDRFILAYQSSVAAPNLMLASFTSAGSPITNLVVAGESNPNTYATIGIGYSTTSSEHTLVMCSGAFGTRYAWVSSTTFAITGALTLLTNIYAALGAGAVKLDASTAAAVFYMERIGGTGSDLMTYSTKVVVDGVASATYHQTFNWIVMSKPFVVGGRAYALGVSSNGNQSASTVIADLQVDQNNIVPFHRPVTTIAPRITGGYLGDLRVAFGMGLIACSSMGNGKFLTLGTILRSNAAGALVGMTRVVIDSAAANRHQMVEIGENLHLSGGVPSYYDGRGVYEIGFLYYVDSSVIVATPSTTGGTMAAGTYVYCWTYEITDAAGQRHRSATSIQKLVTVGGSGTGSVAFTNIPSIQMTCRQDNNNLGATPVEVVVYRSVVGGTTLYRLTPESTLPQLTNGPQTLSWTDTYTDGNVSNNVPLATKPLLYTTGGVLDNVCPPCATIAIVHRSRVWLAGTDDPRAVWYSKAFVTGEAIAFCDAFQFTLEDRNPITALASLDDQLAIFTRSSIYVMVGDGPTDSGVGNDFSTPKRVASDVGCIEPRSIVLMPQGLLFQSEQGIMLLSRAGEVSYLGRPVEDTLDALPVITSAALKPDQNQVIFTVQNTAGSVGAQLIFDYVQNAWSTASVWDSDLNTGGAALIAAARSAAGVYTMLTSAGAVMTERAASASNAYLDGSQWITLRIVTAWIKLDGLQGYQRIRKAGILANQQTAFALTVSFGFDYASSDAQIETKADTQLTTNPVQPIFRIGSQNGASPRCEAIRVTLADAAPSTNPVSTGQGAYFVGLALEIARKPGLKRVGGTAKW